jgi:hypothetical protein
LPLLVLAGYVLLIGWGLVSRSHFQANSLIWGRGFSSPIEAFAVYLSGERIAIFGFRQPGSIWSSSSIWRWRCGVAAEPDMGLLRLRHSDPH